jgi:phosphomannomutase
LLFGEEYTLVAVADYILKHKKGNTVSNMSSTKALKDVTIKYGGIYTPSAVGEVNVVNKMKEFGISLKEVPKEDDARIIYENAWKELKDYLSQMTWTSYYVVINFAINTALVIAFIIMLLDPKTTS